MSSSWAEPGCFRVDDGVHRVPLQMPNDGLRAVNVYVVETPRGIALIDGGWHTGSAATELSDALATIGRSPADIHDIYVTHIHRDHYTLAVALRRDFGARVHLGIGERVGWRQLQELASNVPVGSLEDLRRAGEHELAMEMEVLTGAEPFDVRDWEEPDVWIEPGNVDTGPPRLQAIATPGHTNGHTVFHDASRGLLFSGDHVLPTITPSIGFELGQPARPLGRFLESLTKLFDLPDARLLPAHGAPTHSVHERLHGLLAHHEQRLSNTRETLTASGPVAGGDVARALRWTRHGRAFSQLSPFNQMLAVCETVAHLDLLVERGDVREVAGREWSLFSAS